VVAGLGYGRERGGSAIPGPRVLEADYRPGLAPHDIVVAPVDDGRLSRARGGDAGRGWRRVGWVARRSRVRDLPGERDDGEERQAKEHERPSGGCSVR